MTELTVNLNKTINAPLKSVYEAWLNPEMLAKFIMPMPGMPEPEVDNDAREGGNFTIIMTVGDQKIPHTGKYLIVDKYKELIFTWESPFSAEDSTVTLLFNEISNNKTNIELTHVKFLDEEGRDNHKGGWGNILDTLAQVVTAEMA